MRIQCPNSDCAHRFEYDDAATALALVMHLPVVADCPGPTGDFQQTHLVVSIPHSCGHFTSYTTNWRAWGEASRNSYAYAALEREMRRIVPRLYGQNDQRQLATINPRRPGVLLPAVYPGGVSRFYPDS